MKKLLIAMALLLVTILVSCSDISEKSETQPSTSSTNQTEKNTVAQGEVILEDVKTTANLTPEPTSTSILTSYSDTSSATTTTGTMTEQAPEESSTLSDNEISELARQIVMGDKAELFEESNKANEATKTAKAELEEAMGSMPDVNSTEYVLSVSGLLEKAEMFVKATHYSSLVSIKLIFDDDNLYDYIETSDKIYTPMELKMTKAKDELSPFLDVISNGGKLTAEQQDKVKDIKEQIDTIIQPIFDAEKEAEDEFQRIINGR